MFSLVVKSSEGDEICLGLGGRLASSHTMDFHSQCRRLIKDFSKRSIILDCSDLTYIDSAGIGALMAMNQWLGGEGRQLSLANCQGEVVKVLRLLKLHRVLPIV